MVNPPRAGAGGVSRRTALKAFGAGAVALLPSLSHDGLLAFGRLQAAQAAAQPEGALAGAVRARSRRWSRRSFPPTNDRPAPKEARVADYIDLLLSESEDDAGAAVDRRTRGARRRSGAAVPVAVRQARRRRRWTRSSREISTNELAPDTPLEHFFVMAQAGDDPRLLHVGDRHPPELRYKGNQFLQEFVGCATEDGKDCPHCGQKASTTRPSSHAAANRLLHADTIRTTRRSDTRSAITRIAEARRRDQARHRHSGTSSSSAAAPPAAWRRFSWRWPASRCCCSKPAG